MTDDDRDTDELQVAEPEAAFRGEYEWNGQKLEKFSFVRRTAAVALGLSCWKLTPADFETLENPKFTRLKKLSDKLDGGKLTTEEKESLAKEKAALEKEIQANEESPEIQIYNGMAMDAAIVIWLCLQPDSKCRRARRKPKEYEAELDKWAEENGIFDSPDALALLFRIINDISSSEGRPDLGNNGTPDPN